VRSRKYEGCIDLNRSTRKYEDSLFSIAKVMYTVQSVKTPWEFGGECRFTTGQYGSCRGDIIKDRWGGGT
jgi:hypothetical protein